MGLSRYRIGELINVVDERNNLGLTEFYGVNINKEFMPTAANTEGLDETKYKVIRKNRFVFSGMQTGRDECIRLSMYQDDNPVIISPAYTTFEVIATHIVIPLYFFMKFLSKEMDRYGAFRSDSSIRSNLDWDEFCDIEIDLPSLAIQQKYVDVYNAMKANQESYERGLDDLKLVCDAYIEDLRRQMPCEKIGKYIIETKQKNENAELLPNKSVSNLKVFIEAKEAVVNGVDTTNYLIVELYDFAYNTVTTRNADKLSIALNTSEKCLVSPLYNTFRVANKDLLPEYLCLWFNRNEYNRYARFASWGSARELYPFETLAETEIPIPSVEIQKNIVNIYKTYQERKALSEKLKAQIKDVCPILIKGSIEEGRREA